MSDAPREERSEKLVAHALIIGGVKGAVAGGLLGALPATMVLLEPGTRIPKMMGLKVLAGMALAGACLCALDAASARVERTLHAALLRFAAGFGLPFALFAPHLGIFELESLKFSAIQGFVGVFVSGLLLAMGSVVAGTPRNEAHEPQGCGRIFVMALVPSAIVGVFIAVFEPHAAIEPCGGILMVSAIVGFFIWLAQILADVAAARWVARWLEPEVVEERDLRSRSPYALAEVGESLRAAARDPSRAEALRLEALGRLERLDAYSVEARFRGEAGTAADRRAEALLGLGRLDEAERLVDRVSFPQALRAEVARRRGDLEGAAAIALAWLDELRPIREASTRVKSALASAHAILALVRADQKRDDDARVHATAAAAYAEWYPRAFEYLSGRALDLHLEERRRA